MHDFRSSHLPVFVVATWLSRWWFLRKATCMLNTFRGTSVLPSRLLYSYIISVNNSFRTSLKLPLKVLSKKLFTTDSPKLLQNCPKLIPRPSSELPSPKTTSTHISKFVLSKPASKLSKNYSRTVRSAEEPFLKPHRLKFLLRLLSSWNRHFHFPRNYSSQNVFDRSSSHIFTGWRPLVVVGDFLS